MYLLKKYEWRRKTRIKRIEERGKVEKLYKSERKNNDVFESKGQLEDEIVHKQQMLKRKQKRWMEQ